VGKGAGARGIPLRAPDELGAFPALMKSKLRFWFVTLARFLYANPNPLRSKTL